MRLYKTQYSFRISGNRGYDSNRVRFACREWETGFVFNTRPAAASEDSLQYPVLSPLECCSYLSVRRNGDLSTNIHISPARGFGSTEFLKWRAERKASAPLEPKLPMQAIKRVRATKELRRDSLQRPRAQSHSGRHRESKTDVRKGQAFHKHLSVPHVSRGTQNIISHFIMAWSITPGVIMRPRRRQILILFGFEE